MDCEDILMLEISSTGGEITLDNFVYPFRHCFTCFLRLLNYFVFHSFDYEHA